VADGAPDPAGVVDDVGLADDVAEALVAEALDDADAVGAVARVPSDGRSVLMITIAAITARATAPRSAAGPSRFLRSTLTFT